METGLFDPRDTRDLPSVQSLVDAWWQPMTHEDSGRDMERRLLAVAQRVRDDIERGESHSKALFWCHRCKTYSTGILADLVEHQEQVHGADTHTWQITTRPERGTITAYRSIR